MARTSGQQEGPPRRPVPFTVETSARRPTLSAGGASPHQVELSYFLDKSGISIGRSWPISYRPLSGRFDEGPSKGAYTV